MKPHRIILAALAISSVLAASTLQAEEQEVIGSISVAHKVAKADLPGLAKVDFASAMNHALRAVPGSVIEGELQVDNGYLLYGFQIVTPDKRLIDVEIDAGTGKVLEQESGDHHDDEDDDD